MPVLLEHLSLNLGIMQDPHLRVCTRGNGIKISFPKIQRYGQAFKDVLAKLEALGIELVERRFKAWQFGFGWTAWILVSPVLVGFLVVDAAVCFCAIGRVALIELSICQAVGEFGVEGKREEAFALEDVSLSSPGSKLEKLYQSEDLIYSLLRYAVIFHVYPAYRGEGIVDFCRDCLAIEVIAVEEARE